MVVVLAVYSPAGAPADRTAPHGRACRVVYLVDEATRFGFGYGTLPGHPEQGEETFIVETGAEGGFRFKVRAFSRPSERPARLAFR
jgi:uncharacterized protein (UPF0548 family)